MTATQLRSTGLSAHVKVSIYMKTAGHWWFAKAVMSALYPTSVTVSHRERKRSITGSVHGTQHGAHQDSDTVCDVWSGAVIPPMLNLQDDNVRSGA